MNRDLADLTCGVAAGTLVLYSVEHLPVLAALLVLGGVALAEHLLEIVDALRGRS